jgi:cell division transport system permease protein
MKRKEDTTMKISTFKYYLSEAFKSLKRNKAITVASIVTVTATLFMFGVFLLSIFNVNRLVTNIKSQIQVVVFLKDDINENDKNLIRTKLNSLEGISNIEYENKAQALEKFQNQMGENKDLLIGFTPQDNPLPSSFIVTLKEPQYASDVDQNLKNANSAEYMSGIQSIRNDEVLTKNVISISRAVRWVGIAMFVFLIGVSVFLIMNTIRLAVFSRRREIGIMKFVGATDWFIRWPFIIEGIVMGVIGALVANVSLYYLYDIICNVVTKNFPMVKLVEAMSVLTSMSWQFALAGSVIGAIGSIIAMRRFLDV